MYNKTNIELALKNVVIFSDLSKTLVNYKEPFDERKKSILNRLLKLVKKFVLVTGQPSDDPQVKDFYKCFDNSTEQKIVIYISRGAARATLKNNELEIDKQYNRQFLIEKQLVKYFLKIADEILQNKNIERLIPDCLLEHAVYRINIHPKNRPLIVSLLSNRIKKDNLFNFKIIPEGATSIYIANKNLNKKYAVENELKFISEKTPTYYFGDEFEKGNDQDVLSVNRLIVYAIGEKKQKRDLALPEIIAENPDELYKLFLRSIEHNK